MMKYRYTRIVGLFLALVMTSSCDRDHFQKITDINDIANATEEVPISNTKDEASTGLENRSPVDVPEVAHHALAPEFEVPSPLYAVPFAGSIGGGGGGTRNRHDHGRGALDDDDDEMHMLLHWNGMAIDASGIDHDQPPQIETLLFREQIGPGRSSRAMAIVHIAMFEAVNAVKGGYDSYLNISPVSDPVSLPAALAQAAHDTLSALFTRQTDTFDAQLAEDLGQIANGEAKDRGIELGARTANAILGLRTNDGSQFAEPIVGTNFFPSDDPGKWREDPISQIPLALGARWGEVLPFIMESANQFRAPMPPSLTSVEYATAFNETKRLGGDGVTTSTERTDEQTKTAIFWAYDGTPSLCAPPRLYNQIVAKVAKNLNTDMVALARLFALVNVAMADAAIAVWESKYHYQYWRPVTAIRESDPGTGPSNLGDGNNATTGDINFSPLGAPASNMINTPNFTPPFPAYPSGHAGFGGAIFQILRNFYERDNLTVTIVSDEFNGITKDKDGNVRPLIPRTFTSFSQMEEENGQSRIYLGIHWAFDKTGGIAQGRLVGDYVFDHMFRPVGKK